MSLNNGAMPVATMAVGMMASTGGIITGMLGPDTAVGLALLLQFGGIVWWGSRMQTQQNADRTARLEAERMLRDERVAIQAKIHSDIGAVDQRLAAVERHASNDVERLAASVDRLTDLVEETNRRLSTVEGLCQARHLGGRGQPI